MKKTYIAPATQQYRTGLHHILATSGSMKYSNESIDPNLGAMSKKDNTDWDFWETPEE